MEKLITNSVWYVSQYGDLNKTTFFSQEIENEICEVFRKIPRKTFLWYLVELHSKQDFSNFSHVDMAQPFWLTFCRDDRLYNVSFYALVSSLIQRNVTAGVQICK